DTYVVMWIVPLLSKRGQRLGDMAAGTIVISDEKPQLTEIRRPLAEQKSLDAEFRFDNRAVAAMTTTDVEAVEQLLERWNELESDQRHNFAQRLTASLVKKLRLEAPPTPRTPHF